MSNYNDVILENYKEQLIDIKKIINILENENFNNDLIKLKHCMIELNAHIIIKIDDFEIDKIIFKPNDLKNMFIISKTISIAKITI